MTARPYIIRAYRRAPDGRVVLGQIATGELRRVRGALGPVSNESPGPMGDGPSLDFRRTGPSTRPSQDCLSGEQFSPRDFVNRAVVNEAVERILDLFPPNALVGDRVDDRLSIGSEVIWIL